MPIGHSLWQVGDPPTQLTETQLPAEQTLHKMIYSAPELLSPDWMLIGSEVPTAAGGRIDLLGMAPDGSLVVIELKRDKTPRDVVAQALDYASWVQTLSPAEVSAIYSQRHDGGDLAAAFLNRFKAPLEEAAVNASHSVVLVAAELDAASERIVQYLGERGVAINVLFFRVFEFEGHMILSRAWLTDPIDMPTAPDPGDPKEPWNGEYYVNFGDGESRSWEEAMQHGFVSAGGGAWYSRTLRNLSPGDRIWVRVPQVGYVGVAKVTGGMTPMAEFTLTVDGQPLPAEQVLTKANYHREDIGSEELCEYFVPVKWLKKVPVTEAIHEIGFFGNQNSVAAPRTPSWRHTVDRLKIAFPEYDSQPALG
jgi:hypothetical protein